WRERTVCEQVPCTTYVTECVVEKVPYTVCKKVPHTVVKKVPVTVCKSVPETVVKKVPYTVRRTVTEVVRKQGPYTVTRCVKGAWVDTANAGGAGAGAGNACGGEGCGSGCGGVCGYDTPGPGRTFMEGAQVCETRTYTTTRMVQEVVRKQVPYTVMRTV